MDLAKIKVVNNLFYFQTRMSCSNLKTRPWKYRQACYTLSQVAEGAHNEWIIPTTWQRSRRWSDQDTKDYITSLLQNIPTSPLFVHETPNSMNIIDGQNRVHAIKEFVYGNVTVTAKDVLYICPRPKDEMRLSSFSVEQQNAILSITIPLCIFPPETPQSNLRDVFRSLNLVKPLTSQEIIHSWTHLPLVGQIINVVDDRLADRIHKFRPSWRPKNHRMNHTWIRILATMYDDYLILPTPSKVENWVATWGGYNAVNLNAFYDVCEKVTEVAKVWAEQHAVQIGIAALADIGWALSEFENAMEVVKDRLPEVLKNHLNVPEWRGGSSMYGAESTRLRREFIRLLIQGENVIQNEVLREMNENLEPRDALLVLAEVAEEEAIDSGLNLWTV